MVLADARRVLRLDPQRLRAASALEPVAESRAAQPSSEASARGTWLAVLSPVASADVSDLVSELSAQFAPFGADIRILVIGATLNDLSLMAAGNVYVTGAVAPGEMRAIAEIYRCAAVVLPYRGSGFHALESGGDILACPRAFYDWSHGAYERRETDLALDPTLGSDTAAGEILRWLHSHL
jgi:hypothetical protein